MSRTSQGTKNAITLKGSASIISEYLDYAVNSILYQRGIFPAKTFETHEQYGVTLFMSTDANLKEKLKNNFSYVEYFISRNQMKTFYLTIKNVHSKEVLECWEFQVQAEPQNGENVDPNNPTSNKDFKQIRIEIGSIMRQISATVSYLPLLDSNCEFEISVRFIKGCQPIEGVKANVTVQNSQTVKLRSFSTGVHQVDTVVNYKQSP